MSTLSRRTFLRSNVALATGLGVSAALPAQSWSSPADLTAPAAGPSSGATTRPLSATPADEWTALFDRRSGWIGADGIYSVPLDGRDGLAAATPQSRTAFIFSDTRIGTVDPNTLTYQQTGFLNNSSAVLTGNRPDPDRATFVIPEKGAFGNGFWMNDGIAIGDTLYATGFAPDANWNADRVDLIAVPIVNGVPDYAAVRRTEDVNLLVRNDTFIVMFGVGLTPGADGYVYAYGYRNTLLDGHKDLVVARVRREQFADLTAWRFWSGTAWSPDITVSVDDAAVLHPDVSTELSVTPIPTGRYAGKYLLVYLRNVNSTGLEYAVGDSPIGPFSPGVRFYNCPDPYIYQAQTAGNTYCYNAKAHPSLSEPGRLLISYNVNRFANDPVTTEIYRPRFVWLDLSRLADRPNTPRATTDVAAVHDRTGSNRVVLDLGGLRTVSGYRIKHAGYQSGQTALNTRDFTIETAQRATGPWRSVDVVRGNVENLTQRHFGAPVRARYLRLSVQRPTQSDDTTTRVVEFAAVADVRSEVPDLAQYRPAHADAANDTVRNVTDPAAGLWVNDSGHTITSVSVDLGTDRTIGRYVVEHAGAADLNTRDFLLQSSDNDKLWTTRDSVNGNTSATTDRTVTSFTARYVRLVVTKPVDDTVPAKTTRLRALKVYPA
ncbi:discoidin domain-containing protein [Kribbella sp. NPDC048915]|uniref:galactose-binding domain-containing protein n=1 Tax=Kribbella sp. NPDC048915 TaxID=3155148 RepID=UPI0033D44422